MRIEDARLVLDQLEKIDPTMDLRIVVPSLGIQDLESIDARPVHQNSAWNSDEIVFKDMKLRLQKSETT